MTVSRRRFLMAPVIAGGAIAAGVDRRICRADAVVDGSPSSPFLEGNYAPVQEEITVDRLRVVGKLPAGLSGMYVRTGPNPQFTPRGRYHWFDGDGMLHGVRIQDGRASYRNRYVQTAGWRQERAAGHALWTGLAEPIDVKQVMSGKQPFKNAANTALVWHDGRLLSLWEAGEPYAVSLPELSTIGPYTYGGKLRHTFTAHPKVDPVTGEMMFFGYSPLGPLVHYRIVNAAGDLAHAQAIKLPRAVMMHDFAITEHYSIFFDLPAVFTLSTSRDQSMVQYRPDCGARFGIIPRHGRGDEIAWFEVEACFMFHTLNAFEDGDEVVVLGCRMPEYPDVLGSSPSTTSATADQMLGKSIGRLHEWRFNLQTKEVKQNFLDDVGADFPRIADTRLGRPTQFGYATRLTDSALLKYDLQGGSSVTHEHGSARRGGEGVFVPDPDGKGEDAGWLVTYVHDFDTGQSEMVVVDTRNFGAPPVARVMIPARIPYGFHGTWISDTMLATQHPA